MRGRDGVLAAGPIYVVNKLRSCTFLYINIHVSQCFYRVDFLNFPKSLKIHRAGGMLASHHHCDGKLPR